MDLVANRYADVHALHPPSEHFDNEVFTFWLILSIAQPQSYAVLTPRLTPNLL